MIAIVLLAVRRLKVAFPEDISRDPKDAQQGLWLPISGLTALLAAEASPAAKGLEIASSEFLLESYRAVYFYNSCESRFSHSYPKTYLSQPKTWNPKMRRTDSSDSFKYIAL